MKTQQFKIILIAFITVLSTSCNNLLFTSLDVLRPAKVAFAIDANNLLIVNNTAVQPSNYGHKTDLINNKVKNINLDTDSLSIYCLGALAEDLESKDFFSTVQLIPNSINKKSNFFKPVELNNDSLKYLYSSNNANVILSLDYFKVNDNLSEVFLNESSTFLATLELRIETSWSIHYLNKTKISTIQFKDTLFWDSESYERKKAMSELPKRTDAIIDGALNVGHICVNRFVPYWEKVDRYFFNPNNKLMKQGMDSVYVKNWKSAISLWEKALIKTSNIGIKAQAANNIAIGYEITGDMDKALEYASQSYYFFGQSSFIDYESFIRLSNYMKELSQRKKEIEILKIQIGE